MATQPDYQRHQRVQFNPDPVPFVVASGQVQVDLTGCSAALLSGDAAGERQVAFDDLLVMEVSDVASGEVEARYFFGPGQDVTLTHLPTAAQVPQGQVPTVVGYSLLPTVLNGMPCGYATDQIDLLPLVGARQARLSFQVLDFGAFGLSGALWLRLR